jgi:hypothetical protein
MPSPNEKLAESLDVLEALQQGNRRVFRSDDLSRVHREPIQSPAKARRGMRRSGNSAHATATNALATNGTCRRSSPFFCTARER